LILALGNSSEHEGDSFRAVVNELHNLGEDAILFRQDKCLENDFLSFTVSKGTSLYEVVIEGKSYDVHKFSGVWSLKPRLPKELLTLEPVEHRYFVLKQFRYMRQALWALLRDKRWVDDPWASYIAEHKVYQLHNAVRAGLDVPDTLITSDPQAVEMFYHQHDCNMVVKMLAVSPMLNKVIYTNRVTDDHMAHIETVKSAPSVFQKHVIKKYELRITVVGDRIFAARIDSQGDVSTSTDWRRKPLADDYAVEIVPTSLPRNLEKCIHVFMGLMNLRFGCIDMVVTPDDRYLFLEINPNGQWYFVQLKTKMDIARAIANLLVQ